MNSVYVESFTNRPICNVLKKSLPPFNPNHFLFFSSQDRLEHSRKWKHFSRVYNKFGTLSYHTYKTKQFFRKKNTFTLVEMLQITDIEKTDSKGEDSCLNWTSYNGRWKVCVN